MLQALSNNCELDLLTVQQLARIKTPSLVTLQVLYTCSLLTRFALPPYSAVPTSEPAN